MDVRQARRQDLRQAIKQALNQFQAAAEVDEDVEVGELQVADYIVFLLALDTYIRYVEEATGTEDPVDDVIARGIRLLRGADTGIDQIRGFLDGHLPTATHKRMLIKYLQIRVTDPAGVGRRALGLRTLLTRGGASTMRAVFESNRALRQIKAAIAGSMMDDADAALDLFAGLQMQNTRLRAWIDLAAKTAGSGVVPENAIQAGVKEATGSASSMMTQQVEELAATGAEATKSAQEAQTDKITEIEQTATAAARRNLEHKGEPDVPMTKSEVIGVAVAAATAIATDPTNSTNVPEPLKGLDDEQKAAALTDGRVLVAAGAGAGKSTTLVSRISYLIKERGVFPGRILATTFNAKAAGELKERIGKQIGGAALNQMSAGTMHSLFRRFIGEYGTAEEKTALNKGFIEGGASVARTVQRMWEECFDTNDRPTPKLKDMLQFKTQWSGNNISPAQAKATATSEKEADGADWYELYEGLKGAIPGWKPPCEEKSRQIAEDEYQEKLETWRRRGQRGAPPQRRGTTFESFLAKTRPNDIRLGDFDDMLSIFRNILEREPAVRKAVQKMYDHVMVDECVHEDTEVLVSSGESKRIADLEVGESVLSFENGSAVYKKVLAKSLSAKTKGITIHTKSGRQLSMTADHRLYATALDPKLAILEGDLALYLMYRSDMGFRIGTSTAPFSCKGDSGTFRARAERADCMWVLEVGPRSEILFKELDYSLQYQIPEALFEAEVRLCDQAKSDRIFAKYGQNGLKLLDAYGLDFQYPHWVSSSFGARKVLAISAHRPGSINGVRSNGRRTTATLSWSVDDHTLSVPTSYAVYETHGGLRKVLRISEGTYVETRKKALAFARETGVTVRENIIVEDSTCFLVNAGSLRVGQAVPIWLSGQDQSDRVSAFQRGADIRVLADKYQVTVPAKGCVHLSLYNEIRRLHLAATGIELPAQDSSRFELDPIVEIGPGPEGRYFDITVEDAGNFFGNGVLSHNCQDLNSVQFDIIQMMTEHIGDGSDGKSLWMVGDDKQSIYGFRGAKPELFIGLDGKEGWKTRMIKTNYRCEPEFVEAANRLIANNKGQIPMAAVPSPYRTRGSGSLKVLTPDTEAEAALDVVEGIKNAGLVVDERDRPSFYGTNAVLTRTNKELHAYETACIIRGIPYARKGTASFLGAPETMTLLGYTQLVTGDDNIKMQKALGQVINRPNRFFVAPKVAQDAVDSAVRDYARDRGLRINEVNPLLALREYNFQRHLVTALTKVSSGFKFDKSIEKVSELADALGEMQANLSMPEFKTKDLFDSILGLTGTASAVDPATGRSIFVEQTLRETQKVEIRDATGDDDGADDDEDDALGGNISFLYELAKVDPTDPGDLEQDPGSPMGFKAKMARYAERMRDLRIDLSKWDKQQASLPPEQRSAPPAVYLGTVHCSPADEPVLTTEGWVPLGELNSEVHRLASYTRSCNQLFWGKNPTANGRDEDGYAFLKAINPYSGTLLTLTTAMSRTRVTPDHRILVKWADNFYNKYVVYLMRRGDWWRVGTAKSGDRPYSGADFKQRVSAEKADGCWILHVAETRVEAMLEEARVQTHYGITGLTFESQPARKITTEQLHAIHESAKGPTGERALKLLADHGFDADDPLYVGKGRELDMRGSFTIRARNCLTGYMQLPVVTEAFVKCEGPREVWTKPEWAVATVTKEHFTGDVYSLVVPPYHFYISGGAIVHNSTKGAQWDNTFVAMPKGKFPMEPPQRPGEAPPPPEETAKQLEDERRLGYVALTRAAKTMTIICPSEIGGKAAGVSPFVMEANLKLGENIPKPGSQQAAQAEADTLTKTARFVPSAEYLGPEPDEFDKIVVRRWPVGGAK